MTSTNAQPLSGIVVVELGHSVAAPFAGQILCDLGATVIKVEKPEGDDARKWGPPFVDGAAAAFQAINKGKKSVTCHLRSDEDAAQLRRLVVEQADVVIQNLRPGQLDKLGMGAQALTAAKPSLIFCNMGAFGATGPLAHRPGYDPLMQAFGGIMSVVGQEGQESVRVGPAIIDMGTGMWAVIGIQSALLKRAQTGQGCVVDVSLYETAVSWMQMHAAQYLASNELPKKVGSGQVGIVPYRAYRTADGELVVAAGNNKLFQGFCAAMGHPEWAQEPRFIDNPTRVQNAAQLYPLIEAQMLLRTNSEWMTVLDAHAVPCAPVQNAQQMLDSEQTRALGIVQRIEGSSIPLIGLPMSFNGARPQAAHMAPALGAHTFEVFSTEAAVQ
ncbi:MAG: CaiB/BaiF CoA transferase family protein [Comamonas sp.]